MKPLFFSSLAALAICSAPSPAGAQSKVSPAVKEAIAARQATQGQRLPSLGESLASAGRFSTFLSLMDAAGMQDMHRLAKGKAYTILAPNDAAFAALPAGTVEALRKNPQQLRSFLMAHMLPGPVMVQDMFDPGQASSHKEFTDARGRVMGFQCNAHSGMHYPRINGDKARIAGFQDVHVDGGIVHEIDAVLTVE